MSCDCPICLENIEGNTNSTITECGHHFHTNCLMQNAAHNGFGCPYCRAVLASKPQGEEDLDDYSDDDEESIYSGYNVSVLRDIRRLFITENAEMEQEENVEEEEEEDDEEDDEEEEELMPMAPLPDVISKFSLANITYENLVEYILTDYITGHHSSLENSNIKRIYTKLREIDSNFNKNNNRDNLEIREEMNHISIRDRQVL